MKTLRTLLFACGAISGAALFAQEGAPPSTMSTPPPPAPTAAPAPEPAPVDGLIHVQKLPTTAQLTSDAEAEGMTITRMEQLTDRIVVTYRYPSGNTRTFAYTTTLPTDPDKEVIGAAPPAPAPAPAPSYTVIYTEPAPVYYYPRYVRTYDPYWPSTTFSFGFGRSFGTYGHYGYYGRPHHYPRHHRHHGHHHWRR